jgi:xanthosine utilization system XapX-like protein
MIDNLVAGIIGVGMVCAFLAFMLIWVPAPPLIIIMVGVMGMLVYDFVQTMRHGENY